MKDPAKLTIGLILSLALIVAAAVLSSCSQMGAVTYSGNVKGVPVTIVVGGGK